MIVSHRHCRRFYVGFDLITSYQVDCMSSALIPAEAVENDQEQITFSSNKVGSITPLV